MLWSYNGFDLSTKQNLAGWEYKAPIIEAATQPEDDYTAINTIEEIYNLTQKFFGDYLQWRWEIRELVNLSSWDDLNNTEKDISIDLDIGTGLTNSKITYLITVKGLSMAEAVLVLQESFAKNHIYTVESCKSRAEAKDIYTIIAKYLSEYDASLFFTLVEVLFLAYTNQAIMGSNDTNTGDGLFDFIESTSSYIGAGLMEQNFTMQNGDPNAANFINELMVWFRERKRV